MAGKKGFLIQDGQTVVMIGDSITDCGRRGAERPFGNGYVRQAIDLITARYPERKICFLNEGISGDTSVGLRDRWTDDVLVHKPDWVTVLIGINDLHRWLKNPDPAAKVPPELYREAYLDFLTRTRKHTKARLVLLDPFYISAETHAGSFRGQVLAEIPKYIKTVGEMARKFDALHVPLHEVFQRQLRYRPADTFCPEPVHPNVAGHLVMAEALLKALGW